ncbi:unnamed protein product [Staurois parvus]|uniref:Secreted protein n=1 Tax=Staurois parvus TaxID=386267 RepID=A0ABN9H8Y6_9NEOB|nr:unnamed protein product [Staurois parvus]
MGPRTASSCCCQARNLSWALYCLLMLLPGPRVCHGSLYGLPLLLSPSPHSAMCHFQVSSHCWWVPFFVIGCCMASHLLLPPPPHCGSTLWFWPRDCPNE